MLSVWSHPVKYSQPTRDHTPKEKGLSLVSVACYQDSRESDKNYRQLCILIARVWA